jgi:HD-GYP domain-containing protein (c-di-GMP phosphodiesterase class II)
MKNPFFNRGPIVDDHFFFGREKETREILRLLSRAQNCSVVGPVKSGKTSLLLRLGRAPVMVAHGLSPAEYAVVYLSFEGLAGLSAEQFFHLMLRESARQAEGKIALVWPRFEKRESLRFLELKEAVEQLRVAGERLVFCLDEVELAAHNPAFDNGFFSALRHLASDPGVCFVTATEKRLHEVQAAGEQVGSPFADLFSVIRLRPVEEEVAWRAVNGLAAEAGVDLSSERDFIFALGGGWPYHLQVVACQVCDWRLQGPCAAVGRALTEEERLFVSSRAYEQLEPVLAIMWERLGREEREAALAAVDVAGGTPAPPQIEGLTIGAGDRTRPVNMLVERFLRERQRDGRAAGWEPLEEPGKPALQAAAGLEPFGSAQGGPARPMVYAVVRALVRAVEARDRYVRGHADQVARLAVAIANEMGCPAEVAEGVKVAARVHDIGRVSISDIILLKPGPLTELETEIVRTHPLVASQILDALEFPWSVKPAVRYHHERLDGSGYPEGLMGDEIPLGARVLAVADVMAAMTADRPYRRALPQEQALAELRANAGSKYDAEAVTALERVLARAS